MRTIVIRGIRATLISCVLCAVPTACGQSYGENVESSAATPLTSFSVMGPIRGLSPILIQAGAGCGYLDVLTSSSTIVSPPGYTPRIGDVIQATGTGSCSTSMLAARIVGPGSGGVDAGTGSSDAGTTDSGGGADSGGGSTTATCTGTCYYVSPTGSDTNPGTSAAPFRTIQHAADVVDPGNTVIVRDGVYTNGSTDMVYLGRGGTSTAWVTFVSEHKWGAKLDGQSVFRNSAFAFGASYIRVENFEIYGIANGASGGSTGFDVENGGGFVDIVGNNIHDMGKICTDTANGQVGIFTTSHDVAIEQNVIHDIGRFVPGENGCSPSTTYYATHDHGIYLDAGSKVVVKNNIFYNVTGGWGIQLYPHPLDQITVVNNTFAFPNPNREGHIIVGTTMTNSVIANNLFYQPKTAALNFDIVASTDSLMVANNLSTNAIHYDNTVPSGVTYASNLSNQVAATLMVAPARFDFHLSSTSPAIGAAASSLAPPTDYNGVTRKSPTAIGAYESGSTP
jgi:hypothetical protein